MHVNVFSDPVVLHIGAIPVSEAMVTSTAVGLVLLAFAVVLRRQVLTDVRSTSYAVVSWAVEWWDKNVEEIVGKPSPIVSNITGSLLIFIAASNMAGQLPGVHPATATIATTAALAVLVFVAVPAVGVYSKGVRGYFEHYFRPYPLMAPLHLISEISRTFALCMRLFGNVMSGHLVVFMLIALAGSFRSRSADGARSADRGAASIYLRRPCDRVSGLGARIDGRRNTGGGRTCMTQLSPPCRLPQPRWLWRLGP